MIVNVITLEEKVVSDQLLSLRLRETLEAVVGSLEVSLERGEGLGGVLLDFVSLRRGDEGSQGVSVEVAGDSDSRRNTEPVVEGLERELRNVPVGLVFRVGSVVVVLADDLIEERTEHGVGLGASGVHADSALIAIRS